MIRRITLAVLVGVLATLIATTALVYRVDPLIGRRTSLNIRHQVGSVIVYEEPIAPRTIYARRLDSVFGEYAWGQYGTPTGRPNNRWCHRAVDRAVEREYASAAVRGVGWPCVALVLTHTHANLQQIVVDPRAPGFQIDDLNIYWRGALANVGVMAALAGALIVAFSLLRALLRKRLNRCPGCGYPRSGLAVDACCPECGHAGVARAPARLTPS